MRSCRPNRIQLRRLGYLAALARFAAASRVLIYRARESLVSSVAQEKLLRVICGRQEKFFFLKLENIQVAKGRNGGRERHAGADKPWRVSDGDVVTRTGGLLLDGPGAHPVLFRWQKGSSDSDGIEARFRVVIRLLKL